VAVCHGQITPEDALSCVMTGDSRKVGKILSEARYRVALALGYDSSITYDNDCLDNPDEVRRRINRL
jgi:hypothetical protein